MAILFQAMGKIIDKRWRAAAFLLFDQTKKKVNNHSLLKKKNKSQDDPFAASVVKDPLRTWNVPGFCYLTDFHAADRRWP